VPWADPHQPALGGDVRDLERGPFPETQATGIDHPQTHLGLWACNRGQQGADFWRTPHDGQLWAVPGPCEGAEQPQALQGTLRDEPDAIEVEAEGPLGDLLVMEQRQQGRAECRFAALVRRASGVWRPLAHSGDITLVGLRGKPSRRQVFQQAASKWSHGHAPVRVAHDPSPTVDTNRNIDGRSA
jgi:hypothetical protein